MIGRAEVMNREARGDFSAGLVSFSRVPKGSAGETCPPFGSRLNGVRRTFRRGVSLYRDLTLRGQKGSRRCFFRPMPRSQWNRFSSCTLGRTPPCGKVDGYVSNPAETERRPLEGDHADRGGVRGDRRPRMGRRAGGAGCRKATQLPRYSTDRPRPQGVGRRRGGRAGQPGRARAKQCGGAVGADFHRRS